jgi:Tfp pilus assembly protein PilO
MRDEKNPGRRASDVLGSQVENFVEVTEHRLHHIFIWALASLSIIAITTAVALFGLGFVVRNSHSKSQKVEAIAKRADERSARSAFQIQLNREKVCSQSSNRRVACRALFERLAGSLSENQRIRLACQVVLHLNGPTAEALRKENPQCTVKGRRP